MILEMMSHWWQGEIMDAINDTKSVMIDSDDICGKYGVDDVVDNLLTMICWWSISAAWHYNWGSVWQPLAGQMSTSKDLLIKPTY